MSKRDVFVVWVEFERSKNPDWNPPVYHQLQDIKSVNHCVIQFDVFQVIDADTVLVKHGGETVALFTSTSGMADGRTYSLDGLFDTEGTRSYKAVLGNQRTVAAYSYHGPAPDVPRKARGDERKHMSPAADPPPDEKPVDPTNCTLPAKTLLANSRLALTEKNPDLRAKWTKEGMIRELAADTNAVLVEKKDGLATVRLDGKTWVTDEKNVRAKR